jgi:hypothetical protein
MTEKTKKILFIIVIIFLALAIGFIVWQQITINSLKRAIVPPEENTALSEEDNQPKQVLPDYLITATKNDLITNTKEITGIVNENKNSILTVEAEVFDLENLRYASSMEESALPKCKKIFSVKIDGNTQFLSEKMSDIKTGQTIKVATDDEVLKQDILLAKEINCPFVSNPLAGEKIISGQVEETVNGTLIIVITEGDKKGGKYTLKAGNQTEIIKRDFSNLKKPTEAAIKFGDIKNGDSITAISGDPIGDRTEFEPVRIELLIGPAPGSIAPPSKK